VLKDEMTDEPAGLIDADGNTRETAPDIAARVRQAFDSELMVRDGEVVEELGICFDGVCSIGPADPQHNALVLRNLGALTGLRPEARPKTPEETE
jgi:hypothetical protein